MASKYRKGYYLMTNDSNTMHPTPVDVWINNLHTDGENLTVSLTNGKQYPLDSLVSVGYTFTPLMPMTPDRIAALEYAVEQLSGGKKDEEEADLYGDLYDMLAELTESEGDDAD